MGVLIVLVVVVVVLVTLIFWFDLSFIRGVLTGVVVRAVVPLYYLRTVVFKLSILFKLNSFDPP